MTHSTHDTEHSLWSNQRILLLVALSACIVCAVWRLPDAAEFLGRRISEIVVALVLAMACTYVLRPPVNALCRTRLYGRGSRGGRGWATLTMFFLTGGIVYVTVSAGLRPITKDVHGLVDSFEARSPVERQALVASWRESLRAAIAPVRDMLPREARDDIEASVPRLIIEGRERLVLSATQTFSHAGFVVELILIPVLVFYFLSDGEAIRAEARLLVPVAWRPRVGRMIHHLDRVLDGYTRGQVMMCLIAWFLVTLGLFLLHVPHPFVLGFVAGLTRAVPVIGPLLGGVPLTLICLLQTRSLSTTVIVLLGFTFMHFLESKVLLPKIVGHEVDLHPVSVILALLIGMALFGFMGVFLAVPIAAVLKIVLAEWHESALAATPELSLAISLPPSEMRLEPASATPLGQHEKQHDGATPGLAAPPPSSAGV